MKKYWADLSDQEKDLLFDAPAFISILIGGADDDFDKKERAWAKKLAKYRTFTSKDILNEYYMNVDAKFDERLDMLMETLPEAASDRNPLIAKKLEQLNPILSKINNEFALELYKSLKSYAEHIAKSSGGLIGYFTIGEEENSWLTLDMIQIPS